MTQAKLILNTVDTKQEALQIARTLLQEELVACVNIIGPLDSLYRWKGNVESALEFILLIKTTAALAEDVKTRIRQMHSYELPELIEIDIDSGSSEYLRWIGESVKA